MSSPASSDASTASLEFTKFHSFHVNKARAIVSWTDDDGQQHHLSGDPAANEHVAFDVHHEPEADTALFKIIANIAFKGKRHKSNIFLYIYPERIRNLSLVDNDESVSDRLGTSAYTVDFSLTTCSALVVPQGDRVPKNESAQSVLASLQALSRMTAFRVAFPSRALSKDRLVALCEKASLDGCLKTTADAASLAKLYGGQGGKVIEQKDPEIAVQNQPDQVQISDSPPSYGDSGACPPPHPSQIRKRRRVSSDSDNGSHEKMSLEEICKNGFAKIGRRFDRIEKSLSELTSRLGRVEQLVQENHRVDSSLTEDRTSSSVLGKRIDGVEERVVEVEDKLEVGLSDLAEDIENQMHDVRNEFNDQISVRVDDEMGVVQSNLEDFVKDELQNIAYDMQEAIREKLRDALS